MKVLLLGGNGFGRVHATSYRNLGLDFSVFSRSPDVLEEYRKKYGVKETFNDINEALNSQYDAVDIVLPHGLHYKYSILAMEKGKHVLIEKPIASSVDEARKMISEAGKRKVKFMVAEQYFFDAGLRKTLDIISKKSIGKIHTIIVRDQRHFARTGVWRNQESLMGGGALIDGGVHYIEALLDLGGPYEEIHSYTYRGGSTIQGEDNTAALFSFRSGAHGIFYYSWGYQNAPLLPSYEVIGTEGSIYEDLQTKPLVDFKFQDSPRHAFGLPVLNGKVCEGEIYDVFDREISAFMDSVENDTDVPYNPAMALRNLEAVLEIYGK